jgi:hypothetical protein
MTRIHCSKDTVNRFTVGLFLKSVTKSPYKTFSLLKIGKTGLMKTGKRSYLSVPGNRQNNYVLALNKSEVEPI